MFWWLIALSKWQRDCSMCKCSMYYAVHNYRIKALKLYQSRPHLKLQMSKKKLGQSNTHLKARAKTLWTKTNLWKKSRHYHFHNVFPSSSRPRLGGPLRKTGGERWVSEGVGSHAKQSNGWESRNLNHKLLHMNHKIYKRRRSDIYSFR